jgi:hypothetical protein
MNDELEEMWTEWAVAHLKVQFIYSPGGAEENHGNLNKNNQRAGLY